jgi:ketosteroid isomerase-like protein
MTTDTQTPAGVIATFGRRVNAADLDGALELYEPDAVFQPSPDGEPVRGLDAIRTELGRFLDLGGTIECEVIKVHEAGGIALVANRWTLDATMPDGTPFRLRGTSADVLRRRTDGSWGILVDDPWGAGS